MYFSGWKCHLAALRKKNSSAFARILSQNVAAPWIYSCCLLLFINEEILKPVFMRLFITNNQKNTTNKYLLIYHASVFESPSWWDHHMVSFRISPGQVYSANSQLPHQLYTAHYPWSSLQLATYSMWHLLPSSNEFFMSPPLPLTRRRGLVSAPFCKSMLL